MSDIRRLLANPPSRPKRPRAENEASSTTLETAQFNNDSGSFELGGCVSCTPRHSR